MTNLYFKTCMREENLIEMIRGLGPSEDQCAFYIAFRGDLPTHTLSLSGHESSRRYKLKISYLNGNSRKERNHIEYTTRKGLAEILYESGSPTEIITSKKEFRGYAPLD